MPLYSYKCSDHGPFDEMRPMADREAAPCPTCGVTAKQVITAVRLDYLKMGLDLSLPTAADKWAKMHEDRARRE